jgi:hypothetical protein
VIVLLRRISGVRPRRATQVGARGIWVALMLKLVVEADPVHPLEDLVPLPTDFDRSVASNAHGQLIRHGFILAGAH